MTAALRPTARPAQPTNGRWEIPPEVATFITLGSERIDVGGSMQSRAAMVAIHSFRWDLPLARLRDGTFGYSMECQTDCFQSAIATVLQVPKREVPDPQVARHLAAGKHPIEIERLTWAQLDRWLDDRGLRLIVHRTVPVARRRWIGIVPVAGWFRSHCLVMSRGDVLFDPAPPAEAHRWDATAVRFGFSFPRKPVHHEE
jgi:hypothetical protein